MCLVCGFRSLDCNDYVTMYLLSKYIRTLISLFFSSGCTMCLIQLLWCVLLLWYFKCPDLLLLYCIVDTDGSPPASPRVEVASALVRENDSAPSRWFRENRRKAPKLAAGGRRHNNTLGAPAVAKLAKPINSDPHRVQGSFLSESFFPKFSTFFSRNFSILHIFLFFFPNIGMLTNSIFLVLENFTNSNRTPPFIDTCLQIFPNFENSGKNALR